LLVVPTTLVTTASERAEIIDLLRGREPEGTVGLVKLLHSPARHTKAWVTRDADGRFVGMLISARYSFDRWYGFVLLDDLSYAQEVARTLDRSNVWSVVGPAEAVEAVLRHTGRSRSSIRLWFYAIAPQLPEPGAAGLETNNGIVVRRATASDIDGLVELYSFDEHNGKVPRRRLRRAVSSRASHTLVAEDSGRIVGGLSVQDTGAYRLFDLLIVHPDARGKRIGMALLVSAGTEAVIAGRGVCGLRAMSNGLRVSHDDVLALGEAEVWAAADLRPPIRFRGHQRLRKLLEQLEGGPVTAPAPEASPYSVLPEQRGSDGLANPTRD
jgi:GNAT superfamily N-acetyltransferase